MIFGLRETASPSLDASSAPPQAANRLPYVDMLRIFAAICVCLSHLCDIERKYDPNPILPEQLNWGVFGVDMFFVLSGYLMVVIAKRKGDALRPLPYLADRAARIYPLYWLVTGALVILWFIRPDMVFSSNADPSIWKSFALWPHTSEPLHALGYSLIHFMFFYIVFAALAAVFGARRIVTGVAIWGMMLAVVNVSLYASDNMPTRATPEWRLIVHPHGFSFILGALAAGLPRNKTMGAAAVLLGGLATLFSLFGPQFLFDYNMKLDEWGRIAYRSLPFVVLVYGAGCFSRAPFEIPFQRKLADIAFATILIHVLTFSLIGRLWAPFAQPQWWDNAAAFALMSILTIAVSWVAYELLERPICNFIRAIYRKSPAPEKVI